jgi:hypothetical protein
LQETLSPQHVRLADLAGEKIRTILTRAPGKHKRLFVKEELEY